MASLRTTFLRHPAEVPAFAVIPDEAICVLLDFWWNQDEVHRLAATLPVEQISVSDWDWALDIPFGRTAAGPYTLRMRQALMAPHLFPTALEHVDRADLRYPVLLCEM